MTDTTTDPAQASSKSPISMGILAAGAVASMVMGMWEMILEALLSGGKGFWSPLVYIGATVKRSLQDLQGIEGTVSFDFIGVILGLMGHMMNSMIFGVIFALIFATRLPSLAGKLVAGMAYGAMIYVVMWWVILPLIDPVMNDLNGFVFFLAHLMWGAALALIVRTVNNRAS